MKFEMLEIALVISVCTIIPFTFGNVDIFYTLTEEPTILPTTTAAVIPCDSEYSCLNCTTARICTPVQDGTALRKVVDIPCSGSTPWCSKGNCVSAEPEECAGPTPVPQLFTCMRDGYFPDLTNCSRYYQCVNYLPYLQECHGYTPYYCPDRQKCFGGGYECSCAGDTNPCSGLSGVRKAIEGSQKYFVYCVDGAATTVDRCIGGYVFDSSSSACSPSCPHAGLFPDDQDCTKYYQCSVESYTPDSTSYYMTTDLSCPQGQGFLEEAYECLDTALVPNCNLTSSSLFN